MRRLILILALLMPIIALWPMGARAQLTTFVPSCAGSNDTAAFSSIISAIGSNAGTIQLPYKASASRCAVNTLSIPANITLDNNNGSGVRVNTGQTLTVLGPVTSPPTKRLFYNLGTGLGSVSFAGNAQINDFPVPWFAQAGAGTVASPYTGWDTAIVWSANAYHFGGFRYSYSTSPNWAVSNIKLFFEGATLLHTGSGVVAKFENSTGLTEGVTVTNGLFIGNVSSTDGLSIKSVHKSTFWNLRFAAIPASVLHTQFAISDTFKVQYSLDEDVNVDGLAGTIHPQYGYYLESFGGNPTQDCTFIVPIIEGVTVAGIFLNSANVNRFSGGTVEANTGVGVRFAGTSRGNEISHMDLECNNVNFTTGICAQGNDIQLDSGALGNNIVGVESLGSTNIEGDATTLSGQFGDLTLAATADSPYLFNIRVTGSFTNNGTSTYVVGQSSPLQYTIGGQVLKSVSATTLRVQPTAAGQLSIINTPSGNNGSVLSLDSTDRVADASNIAGFGMFANAGAATRLYAVGVGTATRQNIELCADQATPNSSSCGNQLKLPTTGGVQIGGGTTLLKVLSGTASLDFGATAAGTCDTLTIAVTGAADGDTVMLGIPNALATADTYQSFHGFVSGAGVVSVKRCNLTNATTALSNPSAATVRATVLQF